MARGQAGFAVIEVVISAVVMVAISGAALTALSASDRAVGEERHRARADGIAQEDQARLRSMRISTLANLNQARTVTADNTGYTVTSTGEFVTDSTGTASCTQGQAAADYIRISSSVSWPTMGSRPPVLLQSVVAPPNGAISDTHGALAVSVQNAQNQGIGGIGLSGTGAGSFSGATASNGCAIFGDLPQGNYTLQATTAGLVDRDGDAPKPLPTSVVGLSTNTVVLQYDSPGSINVSFTTRVGGSLVASSADSVVAFNTGMTAAEAFGTLGSPQATITAGALFPFVSPDTVYAGNCTDNNPNPNNLPTPPGAAALAAIVVPAGGSAITTLQLPALHLTVHSGTGAGAPGTPVNNARVTLSDTDCETSGGLPVKRTFNTNATGNLPDRGLPWSTYDVCVDNGTKRVLATANLESYATATAFNNGTTLEVYLGAGATGTCP